ncbi:hypothetical protein BESB_041070 [Besnoitia besnoiti]|uniref:Uncharacterized protein n=1 Tax=Besnoitia besnoiti TaxID=94643 RepID=A0A2A9MIB9_BESBE|nr:hypothetical protein BESB_041070 [Besnoitia besnoiti]PFH37649.1 hypothetical protein BESB_041070 [Besnoitia besnoiti]
MRRRLVLALTNAAVSIGKAVPSAPEADYDRRSPCDLNRQPPVPRPGASAAAHPSGGLARSDFVSGVGGQQDEEAGCCADSYDALKGSSPGGPVSKAQAGGVSAGRFSAEAAALERGYRTGREHSRDPRTSERGAKAAGFTKKRRRETSRGSVAARELVTPEFVAHAMQWLVMLPFMIVVAESQVKCVGSHPEVERLQREAGVGSLDRRLRDKKDAQSPIFLECEFVGASGQRHNAQQNTTYIHTYGGSRLSRDEASRRRLQL